MTATFSKDRTMSSMPNSLSPLSGRTTPIDERQAGESAVHADRSVLLRKYEQQRLHLVELHSVEEPDWTAIDTVIDDLARLQSDIKATSGLIGNNPIER